MKSVAVAVVALLLTGSPGHAADSVDFHGKTVSAIIGFPPGGGTDILGRAFLPYFEKYLPGNPAVVPKNVPGANGEVARPAGRQVSPPFDAAQPLEWVEDPGLAPNGEVEAGITIGQNVEPGHRLLREDAGDSVEVLLTEERVAHGDLEGAGLQILRVPVGLRVRTGDGRREHEVLRDGEHGGNLPPSAPTSQAALRESTRRLAGFDGKWYL